jgi:hypothetical protein
MASAVIASFVPVPSAGAIQDNLSREAVDASGSPFVTGRGSGIVNYGDLLLDHIVVIAYFNTACPSGFPLHVKIRAHEAIPNPFNPGETVGFRQTATTLFDFCINQFTMPNDVLIGNFNNTVGVDVWFYRKTGNDYFMSWNYFTGAFTETAFPGPSGYQGAEVADIDGDGDDDILWHDTVNSMQEVVYETGVNNVGFYTAAADYFWAQVGSGYQVMSYTTQLPTAHCTKSGNVYPTQSFAVAHRTSANFRFTYYMNSACSAWLAATSPGLAGVGALLPSNRITSLNVCTNGSLALSCNVSMIVDNDGWSQDVSRRFDHGSWMNFSYPNLQDIHLPSSNSPHSLTPYGPRIGCIGCQ